MKQFPLFLKILIGLREEIMSDIITKIGKSTIQHGKYNNRIYLMKLSKDDFPGIIIELDKLALDKGYTKIFAKVPGYAREEFEKRGYKVEAHVPGFYNADKDAFFMGEFFTRERAVDDKAEEISKVLNAAQEKSLVEEVPELETGFKYRICTKADAKDMAQVYKQVFKTYPFPIHDPEYIMKTMDENIIYFCILDRDRIVALSSAEMDVESENVEMTDFATLPEYRGRGFSIFLLHIMEREMRNRGIKTAYTIARALSYGMNISFAKAGYTFSGTLVNNTNIYGHFESMNVWYKKLY